MASIISAGTSAGTALNLTGDTSGALALQTNNGTTAVTIDTSQNVGIGTATPGQKFVVAQGTKATTASVVTSAGFNTTDSSPFGLFIRQKTDATAANRWSGITSFDNAVGNATLVLQDLGGYVGVGLTNPTQPFMVATDTDFVIGLGKASTGVGARVGAYNAALNAYKDIWVDGATVTFATSGVARMQVNANAPVLCLSGGNTSATGTGIAFPATQNDSTDANTLDDYEEGTFTPSFPNATATYGSTSGTYTKIGRLVHIVIDLTTTALTRSGSDLRIGGLPFGISGSFTPPSIFLESGFNPPGGAGTTQGLCILNSSYINLYTIASSTGNNYVGISYNDLQTGTNKVRVSACYVTA